MNQIILVMLLVFTSTYAVAKKTDGQFDSKIIKNNEIPAEIEITSKKGFHFNDKAPTSIVFDTDKEKQKPSFKSEKKMNFKIIEKSTQAEINFYMCDDAKTVCEQQKTKIEIQKTDDKTAKTQKVETKNKMSFKSKTPTLLVFSAPWCPACIRLKTETLNQKNIENTLKKLSVQTINIDLVENENLSNQFDVKAIPTVVLLNKKGDEVFRWLDYQPADSFSKELDSNIKLTQSLADLQKLAEKGNQNAILALAKNAESKMKWEEASWWFSQHKDQQYIKNKLLADVNKALEDLEDKTTPKENLQKTVLEAYQKAESIIDKAEWMIVYFDDFSAEKKPQDLEQINKMISELKIILKGDNYAEVFEKSITAMNRSDFGKIEVLDKIYRLQKLLGKDDQIKVAKADLKEELKTRLVDYSKPGQTLDTIYYFDLVDDQNKIKEIYKNLIEKNAASYVYYQKYANYLFRVKEYNSAEKQINEALKYIEGNEPQLNTLKIKILVDANKKKEASELIEKTLKIIEPHPTKYKRTAKQLNDLKTKLK